MNQELGLQVLSQIMSWDDDEAREEFRWLTFMSQYKYDDYSDYLAGVRFLESLATWLQQFDVADRRVAYQYIKNNLIYNSTAELHRLVEKLYPEHIQPRIVQAVSNKLGIQKHRVWATAEATAEFDWQLRKALFMGLSDGAKIDVLRRANVGIISNEQIVASTQVDTTKWQSFIKDLRQDLEQIKPGTGNAAKFSRIYLIDDFTASGTSLIRKSSDAPEFKGKLERFFRSIEEAKSSLYKDYGDILEDNWELIVHHYICTESAKNVIISRYQEVLDNGLQWFNNVYFTFSLVLPADVALDKNSGHPFVEICKKYYNDSIENKHTAECGDKEMSFGYCQCALPLVLEHNTPNNSLPLLWAETTSQNGQHAMRPLFRRRQRHAEIIE